MSSNPLVNIVFYKLLWREAEVFPEDSGMVFQPIEIAFQLEYGFLFFDGAIFDFQDELDHAPDFEDITYRLEPADAYTIERVAEDYMDTEIHLSNQQLLRIRQLPDEYNHKLQSWLDITPAVESGDAIQPILYANRKPGFLKRFFNR